jgi:hypothetical protein
MNGERFSPKKVNVSNVAAPSALPYTILDSASGHAYVTTSPPPTELVEGQDLRAVIKIP